MNCLTPRNGALLILVLAGAAWAAGAQRLQAGQASPVFRTGTDLVHLNVTVTGLDGGYVTGLGRDAFAVFEDGVPQQLEFFAAGEVPLDLALLLDTSGSMSPSMQVVRQAAIGLIRSLRPGDRAAIIEFNDVLRVRADFTDEIEPLEAAIRGAKAHGGTALYTGVYVALTTFAHRTLGPGEIRRPALVLLSDGADTVSRIGFDDVVERARGAGVTIYTISLVDEALVPRGRQRPPSEHDRNMRLLARETGGRPFFPQQAADLDDIYGAVVEELSSQYTLAYSPTNASRDGAFRRITVQALTGGLARTRSGYFGPRPSTSLGAP